MDVANKRLQKLTSLYGTAPNIQRKEGIEQSSRVQHVSCYTVGPIDILVNAFLMYTVVNYYARTSKQKILFNSNHKKDTFLLQPGHIHVWIFHDFVIRNH